MKRKLSPYFAVNFLTLSLTLGYIFVLAATPPFVSLRLKAVDTLFRWRADHAQALPHQKDIVIIGVDDESYQRISRPAPWGREIYAVFLENLQALNPKAVGMDFTLIGKSVNPRADAWLAEAISRTNNVTLAAFFDHALQYHVPDELFAKSARAGYGFVDKPLDRDGVNRRSRTSVAISQRGETAYSFSVQIARAYFGNLPNLASETDVNGQSWISYRYRLGNFPYIPFWKVVAGEADRREIENKIVLVGPITPVFHDIHATPLGLMAGIVINANELLTILDGDFISRVAPEVMRLLLLVLTLVFTFVFYRLNFFTRTNLLICAEAALFASSVYLFMKRSLLFEPFPPMFVVGMTYVTVLSYKGLSTFLENRALQRQVITDGLTGLYGHRYLTVRLENEFKRTERTKTEFCFVMVDIDFFKKVNDTYGHEQGNVVLTTVAKLLKNGIRGYDVAARYGGEEFSLVLFNQDPAGAAQIVERIRKAVEATPFNLPTGVLHVTVSSGICSNRNPDVQSKDDLVKLADAALYQAKTQGRNRVCLYQPKNPQSI